MIDMVLNKLKILTILSFFQLLMTCTNIYDHIYPLLEGNEPGGVVGSDTRTTMVNWFVSNGDLA